jgi:hypothetical protein
MTAGFSAQQQAWQKLVEQPLAFVEARRLRECWPQTLTDQQHALCSAPRFQSRLLQLLMGHFHLQQLAQIPSPTEQDLPVLLLSPGDFMRLPRVCGAIWHAATLSREIRSDVVNQMRALLGAEVFALALAHRSLAGAADLLRQPADLVEAIDRDGGSCVAAWLQAQPAALRDWLRLRLPMPQLGNPQASVPQTAMDLDIVRHAAATFDQFAEEVA